VSHRQHHSTHLPLLRLRIKPPWESDEVKDNLRHHICIELEQDFFILSINHMEEVELLTRQVAMLKAQQVVLVKMISDLQVEVAEKNRRSSQGLKVGGYE